MPVRLSGRRADSPAHRSQEVIMFLTVTENHWLYAAGGIVTAALLLGLFRFYPHLSDVFAPLISLLTVYLVESNLFKQGARVLVLFHGRDYIGYFSLGYIGYSMVMLLPAATLLVSQLSQLSRKRTPLVLIGLVSLIALNISAVFEFFALTTSFMQGAYSEKEKRSLLAYITYAACTYFMPTVLACIACIRGRLSSLLRESLFLWGCLFWLFWLPEIAGDLRGWYPFSAICTLFRCF
jgi:hypothetical protein